MLASTSNERERLEQNVATVRLIEALVRWHHRSAAEIGPDRLRPFSEACLTYFGAVIDKANLNGEEKDEAIGSVRKAEDQSEKVRRIEVWLEKRVDLSSAYRTARDKLKNDPNGWENSAVKPSYQLSNVEQNLVVVEFSYPRGV